MLKTAKQRALLLEGKAAEQSEEAANTTWQSLIENRGPKLPLKRIIKSKSKHIIHSRPKRASHQHPEQRDLVDELRYQAKLYEEKIGELKVDKEALK